MRVKEGEANKSDEEVTWKSVSYDPTTDKVLIADPNKTRNNKWWSVDRVVGQLKGTEKAWSFYKA
jgi:hypothetical protein